MAEFVGEIVSKMDRSWSGGWTVVSIRLDGGDTIRAAGPFSDCAVGSRVVVAGSKEVHPKYGPQIKALAVVRDTPSTIRGAEQWLQDALPQIGEHRARKCVEMFGVPGIWDVIENRPQELEAIDGLTAERVDKIVEAYNEMRSSKELYLELIGLGLTSVEVKRFITAHKKDPVERLKADPYVLYYSQITSLRRADHVAAGLGIAEQDIRYHTAHIIDRLRMFCYSGGHTYVETEDLYGASEDIADRRTCEDAVHRGAELGYLCTDGDAVSLIELLPAESIIADHIHRLLDRG